MNITAVMFDLAFVVLVLISILDGRRKGFVKIILSFAAMLVTWFVASELSQPVAEWANEAFVGGWITSAIEGAIADTVSNGSQAFLESVPEYISNAAQIAGISLEDLASQLSGAVDPAAAAEKIYGAIESKLVLAVLRIISFFVLYVAMNWVTSIVIGIIGKVFKLPVLKGFNKLLGSVVGAFKGVFVVAIVSIILGLVAMVIPETPFAQALDGSVIHGIISDITHVIFANN